ncbi:hypothetical protein BJX64DRAFT_210655 [Aspergillus heterothallicus]
MRQKLFTSRQTTQIFQPRKSCMSGSIATIDTSCFDKRSRRPGPFYHDFKKWLSQTKLLEYKISYDPSHQLLYNVLIKVLVTLGYLALMTSPIDLSTPILNCGMPSPVLYMTHPKKMVLQRVFENLRSRSPSCEPYVLTHCDLDLGNIIAKNGSLVGVLD